MPDTPATRRDSADYAVAATRLDGYLGRVLDALERSGQADRTLVICTTDHGLAFPRMKCNLTDHGLGVMLILRGPEGSGWSGGRVVDAMVNHIDVFPTVCETIGIDRPPWVRGRSMTPLLGGGGEALHRMIFAEINHHAEEDPQRCARSDRYKYIRRCSDRIGPALRNCDPSVSKNELIEAGWGSTQLAPEELYDLTLDPMECNNVIGDPARRGVAEELGAALDEWQEETGDPLFGPRSST